MSEWTDARVELLKKLWAEGLSASQVASQIGGITRNAVIGKVTRLGLAARKTTSRVYYRTARPRKQRPLMVKVPTGRMQDKGNAAFRALLAAAPGYVEPAEDIVIPLAERKTLDQLEDHHCRWPMGDPRKSDFHFCAKEKVPGLPYCGHHARRAYQTPAQRRAEVAAWNAQQAAMKPSADTRILQEEPVDA
jgi:GcrA cell cycle regulator